MATVEVDEARIRAMPKVELHVHLEGSIRPETLLTLARRNGKTLPYDTVAGLREWYRFTDFPHFVEIYIAITNCLKTPDDIELIAREFLQGQADQNIVHSEVTYTVLTVRDLTCIDFETQLDALNRARRWAECELGVTMALIVDIAREVSAERGRITADWVAAARDRGVDALGLGGYEVGHPPFKHAHAFDAARGRGVISIPHAGETEGPASIWGALRRLGALRIGHGVRCLEDPALVEYLRTHQVPLEVCPSSNVCLGVASSLKAHPLPKLIAAGLNVTINSDDPPLFNTTLTDEYLRCAHAFGFDFAMFQHLTLNAVRASLMMAERKRDIELAVLRA
jgi:adenosine deaminase